MEEATKVVEQPHSCEISTNAKGQFAGKVKMYGLHAGRSHVLSH